MATMFFEWSKSYIQYAACRLERKKPQNPKKTLLYSAAF